MRRLFSYDYRFFIRCIQTEDVAEMHRFLKEYHQVVLNERTFVVEVNDTLHV